MTTIQIIRELDPSVLQNPREVQKVLAKGYQVFLSLSEVKRLMKVSIK